MRLYHGTNLSSAFDIWIHGVNITKSLPYLDFGQGFYMTDNKTKAIQRALKKTSDYNRRHKTAEDAYLVELVIDETLFKQLKIKVFTNTDIEWCQFVTYNRFDLSFLNNHQIVNHNKDFKYDIVCGDIADGKIADIVSDVKLGKYGINDIDYSNYYTDDGKSYGYQMSLHTEKSLSCIKSISCDIITKRYNKKSNFKRKR